MPGPFFKMKLELNENLLERLRQLPERSRRNLKRKMVTELGPELQKDVDELMSEPPGPVSDPFRFGSWESMIYYIMLVREDPTLTDGKHWLRTTIIESGFRVEVSDRFSLTMIRVRNIQPKAKYVYGPWQVAGHENTGWGENFAEIKAFLRQKMRTSVRRMWREAIKEARKGS